MAINHISILPPQPQFMRADRRQYIRAKVSVGIELRAQGNGVSMRGETTDLSLGGCYVEIGFTLPVGTLVDITLWIADSKIIAKGKIVTRHPNFGNGIEFLDVSPDGKRHVQQLLDSVAPVGQTSRLGPWAK